MRSFKDLTRDEETHALHLHREAIVIDASLVAYTDYVGEDLWIDDLLAGGITASNATVCMQHNLGDALRELKSYYSLAKRSSDKSTNRNISRRHRTSQTRRKTRGHIRPTGQPVPRRHSRLP